MNNSKIILNVGSIDILHGHELVDIRHDFEQLINACCKRGIFVVITTLAPLANVSHLIEARTKVMGYNQFLIEKYSGNFPVIDLYENMVTPRGETIYEFFRQ